MIKTGTYRAYRQPVPMFFLLCGQRGFLYSISIDQHTFYTAHFYLVYPNVMPLDRENTKKRLNRIEGQVLGIGRMIGEDRYCVDILQPVEAIKSAIARVEDTILKDHAAMCVESAIASGDGKEQRKNFNELVDLMAHVKRYAPRADCG